MAAIRTEATRWLQNALRPQARQSTRPLYKAQMPCTCSSYIRHSSTSTSTSTSSTVHQPLSSGGVSEPPHSSVLASLATGSPSTPKSHSPAPRSSQHTSHTTSSALSLLRSQPSHYIIASIYQRRYLLTPRDVLTLPRLKDVKVGDVIQLDKIHELGSRDYTLRASEGEVLDKEMVQCRATVIEHTSGRMEEIVKFKRRKGYKKTIKHKGRYTRLRVGDVVLGSADG